MQSFAQAAAGKVGVIGVDTRDPASYGSAFVADHKLTYPMLSDPDAKLSAALAANYLPVTLFLGADGGLRHVYVSPDPLDKQKLVDLVASLPRRTGDRVNEADPPDWMRPLLTRVATAQTVGFHHVPAAGRGRT